MVLRTTRDTHIFTSAVPSLTPVGAGGVLFTGAQAKAIRAFSGTQTSPDGFVGFANTANSADLQTSGGGYDLIGVDEHASIEAKGASGVAADLTSPSAARPNLVCDAFNAFAANASRLPWPQPFLPTSDSR
jgi:hypothetical protein